MKRIHIVGCSPRSGTTLLAEAMISCFEIDLFESHEASIFRQPAKAGKIYLTKRPGDICVAGHALRVDPDLYVIYMLRDPRDVICSKHGKDSDRYWVGLNAWNNYSCYGRKLQGHKRFMMVRYEELVSDPDGIQTALMERMPFLVGKALFSDYHKTANPSQDSLAALGGVRPISIERTGNWRNHLPRVAGQLLLHDAKLLAGDLIEYGYEKDDAWLKALQGVCPDTTPSHWPDRFSRQRMRSIRGRWIRGVIKLVFRRIRFKLRNLGHSPEADKKV